MDKGVALDSAKRMADWFVNCMSTDMEQELLYGTFYYYVGRDPKRRFRGAQWNQAFAVMGMLSAGKVFGDEKYLDAAGYIIRELKTLQEFSPFLPHAYGAIREQTAKTPCCYVRDALSGAWGFLEYYRATGKEEFLRRAEMWTEWFLKYGMDETGWPWWAVALDPDDKGLAKWQICNDMQGSFQGGCLNFFYQLYRETGNKKYVGGFFEHIADYFCSHIQQPDGFFRTIARSSGKVPPQDPQNGHHRGNDDLGSLGLLCAYQIYPKPEYLQAVKKFLTAVFAKQREDGHFENSCAAIPVVLNTLYEGIGVVDFTISDSAVQAALQALLLRQYPENEEKFFAGALNETGEDFACARSTSYALLYLLKLYGGDNRFLTCK